MSQGSHLGALGALINNVEHFISRDGSVAAPTEEVKDTVAQEQETSQTSTTS